MPSHRGSPPTRPKLAAAALLAALLVVAVGHAGVSDSHDADAERASAADTGERGPAERPTVVIDSAPPVPPARAAWSGFAFDACSAPSQSVMNRWRTSSPFTGVGIYLGGVHRACAQKHLSIRWVERQLEARWRLLPIWVGPQASCTGYDHRISGKPGKNGSFDAARARGMREARRAAACAQAHELAVAGLHTLDRLGELLIPNAAALGGGTGSVDDT
jgi:hypothetical protein